jgi:hypothetical protein
VNKEWTGFCPPINLRELSKSDIRGGEALKRECWWGYSNVFLVVFDSLCFFLMKDGYRNLAGGTCPRGAMTYSASAVEAIDLSRFFLFANRFGNIAPALQP